jgi:hypothetical protein
VTFREDLLVDPSMARRIYLDVIVGVRLSWTEILVRVREGGVVSVWSGEGTFREGVSEGQQPQQGHGEKAWKWKYRRRLLLHEQLGYGVSNSRV